MLLPSAARTRLRMTTPCLRTRVNNSYSTKSSTSGPGSFSNLLKYMMIGGVVSAPGLWWLLTTRDNATCDDAPYIRIPPSEHWTVEPGPSRDEVTRILGQGAYSFRVRNIAGVSRYDGAQLASNSPCEDQFTHGILPSPWREGSQWMAWGVFDGHSGGQTSELLKNHLLPFVQYSFKQIKPTSPEDTVPDQMLQHAISEGFMNLDDSIIKTAQATSDSKESLQEKIKKLAPAYSGSCALLSMYDSATSTLHVACTGDSRAVLGQKGPDGKWEAIPLSVDQTGKNEDEIARLYREHPDEDLEGIIKKAEC
ncbi:protein serine/threonine phosphatase 2C [Penicillium herquei]|nr:protein serine/threonine phosphatase 2C [Penicillium herquei]